VEVWENITDRQLALGGVNRLTGVAKCRSSHEDLVDVSFAASKLELRGRPVGLPAGAVIRPVSGTHVLNSFSLSLTASR
jgi:hypothetical protein